MLCILVGFDKGWLTYTRILKKYNYALFSRSDRQPLCIAQQTYNNTLLPFKKGKYNLLVEKSIFFFDNYLKQNSKILRGVLK